MGANLDLALSALPLGGYVRMLDEREAPVRPDERQQAYNNRPLRQRAAIVAAGPAANWALAVLLFALVVTPAATAVMLTARPRTAMLCSVATALFSVLGGLVVSAMTNLPPSFCVVALAVLVWAVVRLRPTNRRSASDGD